MSHIGKKQIVLEEQVTLLRSTKENFDVMGPLGNLCITIPKFLEVYHHQDGTDGYSLVNEGDSVQTGTITLRPLNMEDKALWGTFRSLLQNCIIGVSKGFNRTLQIVGVGYRAEIINNKTLQLKLGYSHLIEYPIPEGVKITCTSPTEVNVFGMDKQLVHSIAAAIRAFRKPEPYKGKGIRYLDETILLKAGKKK